MSGCGHAAACLHPVVVTGAVSELGDQAAHRGPRGGPGARRVRLGERADQVRPAEWAGKGRGVPDRTYSDQVLDVRHRPMPDRHVCGDGSRCGGDLLCG